MALINVAINFDYEYFSFVIYFSKNLLSTLFSKIFSSTFFSQNCFFKISFHNFFPKIFFQSPVQNFFFQNLVFEGFTLDAPPFTETKRTLCICIMKKMIYSKRSKLDFSLV